ncbi:MAG TPA: polysaccharide biosynthesis protein [Parvularcula sp.]|nr:polysaccharide biosynthesis protein [Parvularcula sp.]HBS34656.1 polysaccharide biosynthesis protein [Parvularcula sp.]
MGDLGRMSPTVSFRSAAFRRGGKHAMLLGIDVGASVAAAVVAVYLSADGPADFVKTIDNAWTLVPLATSAAFIFYVVGLSTRFWRFVSIIDLSLIAAACALQTAVAYTLLETVLGRTVLNGDFYLLQFLLAASLMSLARGMRRFGPQLVGVAQKFARDSDAARGPMALIAGAPEAVEYVLRQREFGVIDGFEPVGVLDEGEADLRRKLHGVPILGGLGAFNSVVTDLKKRGAAPEALVIAATATEAVNADYSSLASRATTLGLKVIRASRTAAGGSKVELKDFDLSELLGRPPVKLDHEALARTIRGRKVLVTGAGGSIGSELVRQVASYSPGKLVLLELSEFNLYQIDHEIRQNFPDLDVAPILADIRDRAHILRIFAEQTPELVFHAAALKHVPLVEQNPCAGVATNLIGTRNVADAARKTHARAMVQVSTDKAVNPVGMMGATKRLGELYCQALDLIGDKDARATRFFTVRFGNVLGSSGSVVPLFQRQLRDRLPVTVTHKDMTRFFMTIHEAVSLTLHSAHAGLANNTKRGRIFVLDMGEPIRVLDIAHRMIRLSGLEPDVDVEVKIIGVRPGEKLFEELFDKREQRLESSIAGVFEAEPAALPLATLERAAERLAAAIAVNDEKSVRREIFALIEIEDEKAAPAAAPAIGVIATSPVMARAAANDGIPLAGTKAVAPKSAVAGAIP